ncbi:MAG: CHAT domain-containing protein [Microcystaceae cyanobacterium]
MKIFSRLLKAKISLILSFLLGFIFSFYPVIITAQNVLSPEAMIRKGEEAYHNGQVIEAANQLEQALSIFQDQSSKNKRKIAITATNLCRLQIELGREKQAIQTCDLAIDYYQQTNDLSGIQQSQLYQSYALQQIGFYPRACEKLTSILKIPQSCQELDSSIISLVSSNNLVTIEAWRSLGEILRVMGQFSASQAVLEALSLQVTSFPNLSAEIFLSLGNTYTALGNLARARVTETRYRYLPWQYESVEMPKYNKSQKCWQLAKSRYYCELELFYNKAQKAYQKASQSSAIETKIKAKLNQIDLLLSLSPEKNLKEAEDLHNQLFNLLYQKSSPEFESEKKPLTQARIYAKIKHIRQKHWLNSINHEQGKINDVNNEIPRLLQETLEEADQLENQDNPFLVSYIVGTLGSFYEYLYYQKLDQKLLTKSQDLTKEALYLLQSSTSPYLAYQWQWQLARLETDPDQAINYYQSAIQTLEAVRKNLLIVNPDIQFSFRDNIEPLYRELINSLISQLLAKDRLISDAKITQEKEKTLRGILKSVDALQLAELQNFLQCDLSSQTQLEDITDSHALIIYPVFLEDQLIIIYQSSGSNNQQSIDYKTIDIDYETVTNTVKQLENLLKQGDPGYKQDIIEESEKVYQWIIKPIEPILTDNQQVDTLVFVLDDLFRNIPISVLYDREEQKYLLQKDYAIAILPSLTLLQPKSTLSISPTSKILMGGVDKKQQLAGYSFDPIKKLVDELDNIDNIFANNSRLLNQDFTRLNIQNQLQKNQYSAIHWKTHGKFSSNPNDTYLVAYQELIKPKDIYQLINIGSQGKTNPIDLLVLSACETAQGDNRAVLGLAGLAVRSGASSTLSTLWIVQDESNTQLMKAFYQALSQPNMTKAKALHQAQVSLFESNIAYQDPHHWAAYILVGDWN